MQPISKIRLFSPPLSSSSNIRTLPKPLPLLQTDRLCFGNASSQTTDLGEILKHRWVKDHEYDHLRPLHIQAHGYYLGALPQVLLKSFSMGDRATYKRLDELANAILNNGIQSKEAQRLAHPFHVTKLSDDSSFGNVVYQLSDEKNALAFKVYSGRGDERSGEENFQLLRFMEAHGARDTMKTFACSLINPDTDQTQWMLSEVLRSHPALTQAEWAQRGTTCLVDLAEQHQIYIHGALRDRVNGVLVDMDYARHLDDAEPKTVQEFQDMLKRCREYDAMVKRDL